MDFFQRVNIREESVVGTYEQAGLVKNRDHLMVTPKEGL